MARRRVRRMVLSCKSSLMRWFQNLLMSKWLAQSVSMIQKSKSDVILPISGCASSKFLRAFREYRFKHNPDIMCLLETRDLGFIGPTFTWQRGNTCEQLDRALANDFWVSNFPHSLVFHIPRIKSDHRPILVCTNPDLSLPKGRPFRFLAGWTKHDNFKDLVRSKWRFSGNMAESLSDFTSHVKDWNRSTYGFIRARKKHLMKSLGNIQNAMEWSSSNRLADLELEVREELECVLNHEELLWKQKARCD
ncbi:hypothetical protein J1N35_025610 [Gossypium stocksii]|uniref:Endonuclease/exonuclease/phosphatase domain-containing protein n=1 Tax=Gossypium stocksii TaxID=47602 RepID=A0A9D3V6Y0_9ROSI|nr:hypothetical protein J1N35_025610 [Gossypium stocksii]